MLITRTDDIDNQGAAHLAQLEDEKGLRTIGMFSPRRQFVTLLTVTR